MEENYLSSGETAKKLGISQETLRLWEKRGKFLPHHTANNGYRYYTENQIYDFLEGYYGDYKKAQATLAAMSEDNVSEMSVEESIAHNSSMITIDVNTGQIEEGEKDAGTERERQGRAIPAPYHYYSTSRLARELRRIYLNDPVRLPLGKTGYVDVEMWLDKALQIKIMPTAFNTPEHELHPTDYDMLIMECVKSLKNAGNKEFTAAQLVKHMHGNSSGGISDAEIQEVENRIKTMMTWFIRIEISEEFSHYRNLPDEVKGLKAIQGHLLDTVILERQDKDGKTRISFGFPINGCFGIPDDKDVAVILESYSESKKQLTCFPTSLLNVPKLKSSRTIRILINYVVKKIQGLKKNRKGIHTMLFSTIEKDLYMENFPPKRLSLMRKCIVTIVQNCKEQGQITDYEVVMDGKQYVSIKISWEGESKKKNVRNGLGRGNKVHTRKSASVSPANR